MKEKEIENIVKGISERARSMYMEGNSPTGRWWIERLTEALIYATRSKAK